MMRSRLLVLVCLATALSLAVANPAWAKSNPKPKNVVVLTSAQVSGALLALVDMPTGYAASPPVNTQPSATDGLCNGPNDAARIVTAGAAATGLSEFAENPTTGPLISETLSSFSTVQAAKSYMTATRTQTMSCLTYSSARSGSSTNFGVTSLAFSKVADDTIAVRSTVMSPQSTGSLGSFDNIVVRVGNNVINIAEGGLTGASTTLEQQYVGKAVSKLGVAIIAAKPKKK